MLLKKVKIYNYKSYEDFSLDFDNNYSIIIGNNGAGKTTLLEAIHLALTGTMNGRPVFYELSPYIFNRSIVNQFIDEIKAGNKKNPPETKIELYFSESEDSDLNELMGIENSENANVPGFVFSIKFNEQYREEYQQYIQNENFIHIPTEYYAVEWKSFAGVTITTRSIPIKSHLIDSTTTSLAASSQKYIMKIISDVLDDKQKANLAVLYRSYKEKFGEDPNIASINEVLNEKKNLMLDDSRNLSISLDVTQKATWESAIAAFLDNIPFDYIGKGEQNVIKTTLSIGNRKPQRNLILIEEPESHLSFSNMRILLEKIISECSDQQLLISTHSSYVLNKMAMDNVILLGQNRSGKLNELSKSTRDYFHKLPNYDTLRFILSKKVILVEGPADDLIIQKAYHQKYNKLPIDDGIDIISVNGLSFKRFLDIAKLLNIDTVVVTDNDHDYEKNINNKYKDYMCGPIKLCFSTNNELNTLEPQVLKCDAGNYDKLKTILGKPDKSEGELLEFMLKNKTDWALKVFLNSDLQLNFPEYINDAIQ
ncbi:ATP-dependent endonuclease [[Bacillus] enclensis]|uniref:Predicted ATP-dependent endonuclease of the OLD family, contains P-loop ATPase and TOPRIM domains n=1 Tax=[Bacillus] enclensis TaxID=1402860 RepID=A0A0V8H9J8_9BACI|nr:AAA family ATPase [[Bacillus] enclensis]KSU59062.1 ATP-dependent endonuclease [[Bacillus] enclensis]SCC31947.1 Predicted ATP-dependent endonuclease of the OLD family, contains P-loop ATPase and TOPRIM domains [[Bacillus] enclensis]